jgi:vacuolar iron transporter family protein
MTAIYVGRGLDAGLASNVATQVIEHDALGAHGRDELGISDKSTAKPVQAAMASAVMFSVGAALPLLIVLLVPISTLMWAVSGSSLVFLALLGSLAARLGGASVMTAAVRVTFWGALAMALTAGVGALFGVALPEIPVTTDLNKIRHNGTISRRVAGLFLREAKISKISNMDMCATIMHMRRQSQIPRQSPAPIAQYLPALFSLRNKGSRAG